MRRLLRAVLGIVLCTIAFVGQSQPAAQSVGDVEAVVLQGPGPQIRARLARLERYLSDGQPQVAVATSDRLLAELRERWSDPQDALGAEVLDPLVKQVISLRNRALRLTFAGPRGKQGAFIAQLADGAVYADWRYGIPASVTIAQGILESYWGKSAPGNALFGIKGVGPAGSTFNTVIEYRHGKRYRRVDRFRAYHSIDESLEDHATLLAKGSHYVRARKVEEDPDAFARALQGTYASDPSYAKKISKFLNTYSLRRYDWLDLSPLDPGITVQGPQVSSSVQAPLPTELASVAFNPVL